MTTKTMSSAKRQSVSYETWKRTICRRMLSVRKSRQRDGRSKPDLAGAEWVEGLEAGNGDGRAEQRAPHGLRRKEVGDLFEGEEDAADGLVEEKGDEERQRLDRYLFRLARPTAPKATATPAAQAALKISRRLPSFVSYLRKRREQMLPMQLAMCTIGPSFPSDNPAATDSVRPTDLVKSVRPPR
jgi:hypothetical protein